MKYLILLLVLASCSSTKEITPISPTYYRFKIVDSKGIVTYSKIQTVIKDERRPE